MRWKEGKMLEQPFMGMYFPGLTEGSGEDRYGIFDMNDGTLQDSEKVDICIYTGKKPSVKNIRKFYKLDEVFTLTGGDNGNIILSDSVLFDLGSADIKPDSVGVLDELVDVFYKFLSDGENAKYVDSIVISGHTDITGTAQTNRDLSTDRANSVISYLLTGKNGILNNYAQYFCAAGYGATRPVASNDTEEGKAANRRIEISMILKDDTVLEIVDNYLAMELPGTELAPQASPSPSPAA